jgi:5-methylcytosine-specific restriction endonuclease McrA
MVFVLSKNKKPLAPTSNAKARILLKRGKALIHSLCPFVIRLKEQKECSESFTIKLDVGASTTGVARVDAKKAFFFFELIHRGKAIKKSLDSRRARRRGSRGRNTRYRAPRFDNRTRPVGWLAPSVKSRADNVINFVKKIQRYIPLNAATIERVSFDTSSMTNGEKLYGAEFQQGELFQTKSRKYIFNKHNGKCVYCGGKGQEVEHIISKAKGGTNSIWNLTFSCNDCNIKKGTLSLKEFGKMMRKNYGHLEPRKTPKHASIIQSARTYTIKSIAKLMAVETGEGWETSLNRIEQNLPKEHYYDAMCIGNNSNYVVATNEVIEIKSQGRGSRQMCRMDKFGFPRTKPKSNKTVKGFQTGDIVKAVVPSGLKEGKYFGRVAVRSSGYFNITTKEQTIQGVGHKHCRVLQRNDGYAYQKRSINSSPAVELGVSLMVT